MEAQRLLTIHNSFLFTYLSQQQQQRLPQQQQQQQQQQQTNKQTNKQTTLSPQKGLDEGLVCRKR